MSKNEWFKNRTFRISARKLERYQTTKEMLINLERPFCCNAFHISPEAHCGCRSNKLRPSIKISAWRSYDLFNLYSIRAIFIKYRSFLCDVRIFKRRNHFIAFFCASSVFKIWVFAISRLNLKFYYTNFGDSAKC